MTNSSLPTRRLSADKVEPIAGVLIKRAALQPALRSERIVAEAKRQAACLVRDAQRYRDAAAAAGYDAGFAAAVIGIAQQQARAAQACASRYDAIASEVRRALLQFLHDPALLLPLATALAERRPTGSRLRVTVPGRARQLVPELRRRLADAYPMVEVAISDRPAFVVEAGDDIFEFAPDATADALIATAQHADESDVPDPNPFDNPARGEINATDSRFVPCR
ncbi:HrpE/YscL family type III secretion apparatus protein [Burkholderia sp. BE17]|uniref:HrpE/YscL family type III secretion apparatus protein n=1 Tax=Burkholderia sp. BE17 TaxID=2656644 RepID=UPI00128D6546|nr:HrpE/YscL family type III secretion apparatus protein [Burkholderia sp. BE17]MPV71669.1 HrpE/YscL family type III secretion apparatus protein [Burkholderia sp. BE17]